MRKESESIACALRKREPIHSEDREKTVSKEIGEMQQWQRAQQDIVKGAGMYR